MVSAWSNRMKLLGDRWISRMCVRVGCRIVVDDRSLRDGWKMGIYLSSPKTDKTSEDGENAELRFGLSAMQGWRESMEDAHTAILDVDNTSTSIFGIFDGHGGKLVSKFCAKNLHRQVLKSDAYARGNLGASLEHSFLRMDEMMKGERGWRDLQLLDEKSKMSALRDGQGNDESDSTYGDHKDYLGPSSGSTAVVALIRSNKLFVANAGDSRCIMSRRGQAVNLSVDHKPELELEKERINKAGGFIHGGRVNGSLNLTRAIGDMEFKYQTNLAPDKQIVTCCPDIREEDLGPDVEFIVLACDGIWDVMSSQQVVDFVRKRLTTANTLSSICEDILDNCLSPSTRQQEGCDNMSIIIVQFKQSSGVASSSADSSL
ncbi:probable protein phosphatase 2C 60 isoform X2 [Physcomitrium patens]|uniref:protein-serine/threonine phosphatase n=1 Tax=Physcomitrium patens TaxID=3218 RepID=A0A7I4AH48_PHYPA|nr:probable protein phosphatase 2C 21 isoform X2 [Physcomitrium patens]|eukprot:XP_024393465.1 probable protein phosphatase 2C 21 isoform X2 [Physcomitrella patens]